jgi:hypothetical protein
VVIWSLVFIIHLYLIGVGLGDNHCKDTSLNEIGLRFQILLTTTYSIVSEHNWDDLCIQSRNYFTYVKSWTGFFSPFLVCWCFI